MFLLIIIIDDFATLVFVQGSESLVTSYKFVSLLLPSPLAITQCQGNKTEHSSCHILCLDLTLSSPLIGQQLTVLASHWSHLWMSGSLIGLIGLIGGYWPSNWSPEPVK